MTGEDWRILRDLCFRDVYHLSKGDEVVRSAYLIDDLEDEMLSIEDKIDGLSTIVLTDRMFQLNNHWVIKRICLGKKTYIKQLLTVVRFTHTSRCQVISCEFLDADTKN